MYVQGRGGMSLGFFTLATLVCFCWVEVRSGDDARRFFDAAAVDDDADPLRPLSLDVPIFPFGEAAAAAGFASSILLFALFIVSLLLVMAFYVVRGILYARPGATKVWSLPCWLHYCAYPSGRHAQEHTIIRYESKPYCYY
jgi:hypothetical protein